MKKLKVISFWGILILCDVAIAFGISETWVRLFIPVKNIQYFVDPVIGVRYVPNQVSCGHVEKGYANVLHTNSLGMHDIERPKRKQAGVFRIQFYGDSMTAGMGVAIDETIPSVVNRKLAGHHPGTKFEVINMGAGTESTGAQMLTYKRIGTEYDADLVICIFMDDFADNVLELNGNQHAPYYEMDVNGKLKLNLPASKDTSTWHAKFRRKWCKLYRLIMNKYLESAVFAQWSRIKLETVHLWNATFNGRQADADRDYEKYVQNEFVNESWPLTLELIKRFNETVKSDGKDFILVDGRGFNEYIQARYTNKNLENFCRLNAIKYIPGYQKIDSLKDEAFSEYFFTDGHPNIKGNYKIGSFIAEQLTRVLPFRAGAKEG